MLACATDAGGDRSLSVGLHRRTVAVLVFRYENSRRYRANYGRCADPDVTGVHIGGLGNKRPIGPLRCPGLPLQLPNYALHFAQLLLTTGPRIKIFQNFRLPPAAGRGVFLLGQAPPPGPSLLAMAIVVMAVLLMPLV